MKLHQNLYWGSPKHREVYAKRTHVEGFFGVLKGGNCAGKDREGSLYTGLAHESLDTTMFAIAANISLLRSWHDKTGLGDPSSPLLYAEEHETVAEPLTIDEYQQLATIRGARKVA